jgi:hypothetical protein
MLDEEQITSPTTSPTIKSSVLFTSIHQSYFFLWLAIIYPASPSKQFCLNSPQSLSSNHPFKLHNVSTCLLQQEINKNTPSAADLS